MYKEAHQHSTAAIAAYRSGPREERSYGDEALAHIDLITAGILQGDPTGATTALQHVLALPPQMRIRSERHVTDRPGGAPCARRRRHSSSGSSSPTVVTG
ncbi:hypothetical protein [Streptomyces inhibens]|uniref:hypothetical protein n=1 Tax=Streptomyces inhibens TaxID=2293571 RepID=UPI001EE6F2D8|nr:hypothetical protein [Streptomyces inhibens]UKY47899.1 hypothetical protein KI385_03075 [Streptomyces inhibens]